MRRIEQEEWWATAAAKAALFHTIHCLGEYEGKDRRGLYSGSSSSSSSSSTCKGRVYLIRKLSTIGSIMPTKNYT